MAVKPGRSTYIVVARKAVSPGIYAVALALQLVVAAQTLV
jgi:hypothetical protein